MNRKLSATASRRPAQRRAVSQAQRRTGQATSSDIASESLLAHWTAMQQAMVATGALRS